MRPPTPNGKQIECLDLFGVNGVYPADQVRFRPAGYGIVQHENLILVGRSAFTGLWDFPGGGVEPFELMADGMAREFFEETHLHVTVENLVYVAEGYISMFGHPYHSLRFYFRCHLSRSSPDEAVADLGELSELKWQSFDEVSKLSMHATDREALRLYWQSQTPS